jgi:hypothetical protein
MFSLFYKETFIGLGPINLIGLIGLIGLEVAIFVQFPILR